jgi:hypothetical protein
MPLLVIVHILDVEEDTQIGSTHGYDWQRRFPNSED